MPNIDHQPVVNLFHTGRRVISHPLLYPLRQFNVSIKTVVRTEPSLWLLYQPYIWWAMLNQLAAGGQTTEALVDAKTELLIDGYEGSANSFAAYFFKLNQSRPVRLVHHTHAPVQIIKAVHLNVPVLLTIREPRGATLSLTSRWPFISVTQALHRYIKFYTKIEPYVSCCVLSPFEQTTQHLDQAIVAINQKFGTYFDPIDMKKSTAIYNQMGRSAQKETDYKTAKQLKIQALDNQENRALLAQAETLYARIEASV